VTLLEPQLRTLDVYTVPAAAGPRDEGRYPLALAADTEPDLSPDGASILFRVAARRLAAALLAIAGRQGALRSSRCRSREPGAVPSDWRSERRVACCIRPQPRAGRHRPLRARSCERRQPPPWRTSRFNESDGRWSPDGRRLAYVSDEFGQPDVFVQDWPAGGACASVERRRIEAALGALWPVALLSSVARKSCASP
jgi:hypothetical protein